MRILCLLFGFLLSVPILAQDCNAVLLGEIIDFHERTPLEGARISVTGKQLVTTTTAAGKFRFNGLCNGVLELEVSHPECKTEFVVVEIQGDTYKRISLEHHLEELDEVQVRGNTNRKTTNSSQEALVDQQTLEQFSGGSIGDALKQLPGVSALTTGANIVKPIIQGMSGSRILMLNNNVRMQDMEWGDEHAPNIDVNANKKVSVIKGAAALEHGGDAIGGVILMDSGPLVRTDSLFGSTQLNGFTNGRGGNLTTTLVRSFATGFFIKGQASFKYLGDLEAPEYILSNTGVREQGASLNIGKRSFVQGWEAYYSYFNTSLGILRASHIGNVDDLIVAINSNEPNFIAPFTHAVDNPFQEVTHHLAKASYYRRFEGLGKWETQYDFQSNHRFEYDIRVGDDRDKPSLDLDLKTHTLSSTLTVDAKQGLDFKLGAMGRYQDNFANPDTGVRRLIPDYEKYDLAAFAVAEVDGQDNWTYDAGLRYDFTRMDAKKFYRESRWIERGYDVDFPQFVQSDLGTSLLTNPVFDYHNIAATAGVKKVFDTQEVLRLNLSYASRAPNPSELFSDGLHHAAARIELGDLRLTSEKAAKVSLSLEKNQGSWQYSVSPYFHHIDDFILLEPVGAEFTIRGAFPVWSYRQTTAVLYGVDADIHKQWTAQLKTDHSVAWVRGTDTDMDEGLINMPPLQLRNGLGYTFPKFQSLQLGLISEYVFEQQRFPPNISVFSPNAGTDVPLNINTPPDAYHLLSFDARAQFPFGTKNRLTAGLRITNIMDTAYRDYLNRQRYFVDDLGRNIALRLVLDY